MTAEYFGKNSAKVKIQCPPEVKEVSLCIFSCGAMTAVDRAERAGQEVTFHNLEPGIRFLPMYQKSKGGVYSAAGYPFSLQLRSDLQQNILMPVSTIPALWGFSVSAYCLRLRQFAIMSDKKSYYIPLCIGNIINSPGIFVNCFPG